MSNPLVAENDDLNIIFLGGEDAGLTPDPETGELPTAETFLSKSFFDSNSDGCAEKRWTVDVDIVVNQDILFHFSLSDDEVPTDKLDFSSVILHELGHAHSHHHATYPWTAYHIIMNTKFFPVLSIIIVGRKV